MQTAFSIFSNKFIIKFQLSIHYQSILPRIPDLSSSKSKKNQKPRRQAQPDRYMKRIVCLYSMFH